MTAERGDVGWGFWLRWVLANVMGLGVGWGLFNLFATFGIPGHLVGFFVGGAAIALAQWLVLRHKVQRGGWVSLPITLAPALTLIALVVALSFGVSAAMSGAGGGPSTPNQDSAPNFVIEFVVVSFGSLVLGVPAAGIARWLLVRRPIGWAGWGVLGGCVAFAVGFESAYAFVGPPGTLVMAPAMVGLASGISQWRALRGQVSRAGWWVLADALGLAVGAAAAGMTWLTLLIALTGTNYWEGAVSLAIMAGFGAVTGAVGGAITGGVLVWLLRHPISRPTEEVVAASA